MPDGISTDAGIGCGVAWTRTDDELSRVLLNKLVNCYLVIAKDMHCGSLQDEILVDVPSEGVVVVDEDQV